MWTGREIKEYFFAWVLCRTYVRCSSSFTLQVSDDDNEGLKPIVKLLSRDENKVRLKQQHQWMDSW